MAAGAGIRTEAEYSGGGDALPVANGGRMGVRGPGGDTRGPLCAGVGLDRLVPLEQSRPGLPGRDEAGECIRPARHAGEREGMGTGLARRLPGRHGDRPFRSYRGLQPSVSNWQLSIRCQPIQSSGSPLPCPFRQLQRSWFSSCEDGRNAAGKRDTDCQWPCGPATAGQAARDWDCDFRRGRTRQRSRLVATPIERDAEWGNLHDGNAAGQGEPRRR